MAIDIARRMELAAKARQKTMKETMAFGDSDVQRFYNNTTVFVTGGSGFMGKQLIEKLLRACNLKKMYVLLRPKKGKDVQTRLADLLQDPVYDTLRGEKTNFAEKVVAVSGDASEIRLGLNEADWETLKNEVDIVFHLAATTKFDETLRIATLINVRGTKEAVTLARACKKLRSFVYVSTVYSHATRDVINAEVHEKFGSCPIPPETLISFVENVEQDRVDSITSSLTKNWPNTYAFTKAVAEEAVRTMSDGLPVCIVRPGIVSVSYREPSPGWVDLNNVYGASGILLDSGLGLMHCVRKANYDTVLGFIPCDYVNNAIIVAAREIATNQVKGGNESVIYNVTSLRNPASSDTLSQLMTEQYKQIPTPSAIYYNYTFRVSQRILFNFLTLFLHTIPGYILDFVCMVFGKEKRFVKLYTKMHKLMDALSYFMLNEWKFVDRNLETLFENLKEDDKIIFNFDVNTIDWKDYTDIWILGIRKYIIKDGLKNTEYAIKKLFWLRILHYVISTIYCYVIWKVLYLTFYAVSRLFSLFN